MWTLILTENLVWVPPTPPTGGWEFTPNVRDWSADFSRLFERNSQRSLSLRQWITPFLSADLRCNVLALMEDIHCKGVIEPWAKSVFRQLVWWVGRQVDELWSSKVPNVGARMSSMSVRQADKSIYKNLLSAGRCFKDARYIQQCKDGGTIFGKRCAAK